MSFKKIVSWCALAVLLILLVAAISIPNLLRARISANTASHMSGVRALSIDLIDSSDEQDARKSQATGADYSTHDERKIVQTAVLDLIVANVQDTASRIEALAEGSGGYVEKSEFLQSRPGQQSAGIVVRVPQSRGGSIRDEIKRLAKRVESDKSEARDVTREFIDSEARLRNMKVEESQYQELMHRSTSTQDIIEVAARLSDVRGRIEQLTGELQYLSHQVEMSSITITLSTEYIASDRFEWHPFRRLQLAFQDMLEGLTGYADAMISLVLYVPVILLWTLTVIVIPVLGWKILRWLWRKFVRPTPEAV